MKVLDVVKCGYLGYVTVEECFNYVVTSLPISAKDTYKLLEDLDAELGEGWRTHTCFEAADLLGFDLTAYYKQLNKKNRERFYEMYKAREKLGAL